MSELCEIGSASVAINRMMHLVVQELAAEDPDVRAKVQEWAQAFETVMADTAKKFAVGEFDACAVFIGAFSYLANVAQFGVEKIQEATPSASELAKMTGLHDSPKGGA